MRLVSVVTSTRSPAATRSRMRASRSSTWPCAGLTTISGSSRPVGRMSCSTTSPLGVLQLVRPRRRGDEQRLADPPLELRERERAVVERRRQPEPELDERLLARAVAVVHPAHLRDRHVRLVHDQQPVLWEVVEQRRRRLAGLAPRQVAGVVLDAVAVAELAEHVEVEHGALRQALRLEQLAGCSQFLGALVELGADVHERLVDHLAGDDVVRGRVDRQARVHLLEHGAAQWVDAADALDCAGRRTRRAPRGRRTAGRSRARRRAPGTPPARGRAASARTASPRAGAAPRPSPARPPVPAGAACRSRRWGRRDRRCTTPRPRSTRRAARTAPASPPGAGGRSPR